jgi:hypothetical protein
MKASLLRFVFAAVAQVLCVGIGIAWAADKVVEKPFTADTPEKFAQTADQVRKEMAPGGRYEFIRPDDKAKAEADMNAMAAILQKSGSVAAMKEDEKVKLFNAQEHLNGILTHSDRNRLVCENTAPTGSNLRRPTCLTVGEIEIKRANDQNGLQQLERQAGQNNCGMKIKGACPTAGAGKGG